MKISALRWQFRTLRVNIAQCPSRCNWRVHARHLFIRADECWRYRRGVDEALEEARLLIFAPLNGPVKYYRERFHAVRY